MEVWKNVIGYEKTYMVSNLGKVKRVSGGAGRSAAGNYILSLVDNGNGYVRVSLCQDGIVKRHYVHRLVAHAFLPLPSSDQVEINHKDGDPFNNRVDNLEWSTRLENERHAISLLGKSNAGERNGMSVLTSDDVREIRKLCARGVTRKEIASMFFISYYTVCDIVARRRWKHV